VENPIRTLVGREGIWIKGSNNQGSKNLCWTTLGQGQKKERVISTHNNVLESKGKGLSDAIWEGVVAVGVPYAEGTRRKMWQGGVKRNFTICFWGKVDLKSKN